MLLTEARVGAELKAAQARDEIAKRGNPPAGNQYQRDVPNGNIAKPTLFDLGIPRKHAAEMKRLAELGEERIREAVRAEACAAPVGGHAVIADARAALVAGLSRSEPVHGRLHRLGSDHPVAPSRSSTEVATGVGFASLPQN